MRNHDDVIGSLAKAATVASAAAAPYAHISDEFGMAGVTGERSAAVPVQLWLGRAKSQCRCVGRAQCPAQSQQG